MKRKSLIRKVDFYFAKYIKSKRSECELCKNKENLQIHHLFSRKNYSLRWDEDNVIVVCPRCHFWCHQNTLLLAEKIRQKNEKKFLRLLEKVKKIKKYTNKDLEELLEKFKI